MDDEQEPVDPGLEQLINDVINTGTGPIDWSRLHARQHAQQLEILDDWVRWLVHHYGIDQREIPDCWSQHPELVEELAALRTARTAAYAPDAFPTAALDWHHAFSLTRDRLRQWVARTACRRSQHRPRETDGVEQERRDHVRPAR